MGAVTSHVSQRSCDGPKVLVGVAYFADTSSEIRNIVVTIRNGIFDVFRVNKNTATEILLLSNILEESVDALLRFMAGIFHSTCGHMADFCQKIWAPIVNNGI